MGSLFVRGRQESVKEEAAATEDVGDGAGRGEGDELGMDDGEEKVEDTDDEGDGVYEQFVLQVCLPLPLLLWMALLLLFVAGGEVSGEVFLGVLAEVTSVVDGNASSCKKRR